MKTGPDIDRLIIPPRRGMKTRSISAIIRKKMDDWLSTLPVPLKEQVEKDLIVTGGCIATLLLGDGRPNDFDVYLATKESARLLALHYVDEFNKNTTLKNRIGKDVAITVVVEEKAVKIKVQSAGVAAVQESDGEEYAYFEGDPTGDQAENFVQEAAAVAEAAKAGQDEGKKYHVVHLSQNAITLWGGIQVVIRFFGPPEEIHRNFDFIHCQNFWTPEKGVVLNAEALESLLTRELIYAGSLYPICSVIRTRKFIQRGFTCSAGQYLKMMFQINELKLNDMNVLREQLTGVDAAYFAQLLNTIQHDMEEAKKGNTNFEIDASYIAKLIDTLV